jgi:hypothetical protein
MTSALDHASVPKPQQTLADRCRAWWFAAQSPFDLAVCRILFYGLLFALYLPMPYAGWSAVPDAFQSPIWVFRILHLLPVPGDAVLVTLKWLWLASLFLSCVGLFTRLSTIVAFPLTLYLIGLPYNFGKVQHATAAIVFASLILALSRCGDVISLDKLRRTRPPPPPSAEYRWPIRMVWLLMAVVFFTAGATKLRRGGLEWITSGTFASILVSKHYDPDPPIVPWGLMIAQVAPLTFALAAGSVLLELSMPLALFSRRARIVLPAMLFLMQLGIGLLMNVWFLQFVLVYVFWVPWERVLHAIKHCRPRVQLG